MIQRPNGTENLPAQAHQPPHPGQSNSPGDPSWFSPEDPPSLSLLQDPAATLDSALVPSMPDSAATDAANPAPEESSPPLSSATTNDVPAFGWSSYAERVNGRFAMVGMVVMVALELCTGSTVVHWLGLG